MALFKRLSLALFARLRCGPFHPARTFKRLSQYSFLLSPDHSQYYEMKPWRQIESVAHNRWVGAWWQSKGLKVVATISWCSPSSFEYSFEGVEQNAPVAIGMIG
nr:DUF4417 domain-containing protein [Schwartzia sp. (in: firmicutes)]